MVCNFLICAEYATIRPVSNSLFIHAYSSQFFPYAWLAVIPLNFLIVWLYNHFLPKWGCAKLFLATIIFVMGGNLFFALFIDKWLCLPFLFYIWKEVYILLLFQQLYSVIHETVKMDLAKLLYGFFFGIGGIGSLFGSLFPGLCAVQIGSQALLYLSLPFCLLLLSAYYFLIRYSAAKTIHADLPKAASTGFVHGMNLIVSSKGLFFILAIVVLMQAATTIIDFQFNSYLERLYPDKDLRTEYIAKVFGVVHGFTIFFQFIGTYLLLEWIKLRGAHLFVPAVFLCNTAACLFFPGFGAMASAFITTKSFDFSIFNVIKEMLYIPLKADEKFRAKAVIDIFAYRSSKALASFLILAIPYALALSSILAVLYLIWLFVVLKYFRQQDIAVINERS
jgi:AAA family ATP:ADP antiporter